MQTHDKTVKQLGQFGMAEKEAHIYLVLLELGPATVQEVASRAKMNRSTVHVLCEKLKEKGFIGETRKASKRLIFAEDKEKFSKIVQDDEFNLDLKKMTLEGLLPALDGITPDMKGHPKVRFYEGEQGFLDVCQRSLDQAEDEILFLGSFQDFCGAATKEYDDHYYVPERIKRNLKIKVLTFDTPSSQRLKEKDSVEFRETRFLPHDYLFESTMFIYKDEFSMITSNAPFLGVVIESKELTKMVRHTFNFAWNSIRNNK